MPSVSDSQPQRHGDTEKSKKCGKTKFSSFRLCASASLWQFLLDDSNHTRDARHANNRRATPAASASSCSYALPVMRKAFILGAALLLCCAISARPKPAPLTFVFLSVD